MDEKRRSSSCHEQSQNSLSSILVQGWNRQRYRRSRKEQTRTRQTNCAKFSGVGSLPLRNGCALPNNQNPEVRPLATQDAFILCPNFRMQVLSANFQTRLCLHSHVFLGSIGGHEPGYR